MYELFDHTADMGLRVRASDLSTLFAEAAKAFFEIVVHRPTAVQKTEEITLRLEGVELSLLLHDWLNELLYLFEVKRFIGREVKTVVDDHGLTAKITGETFNIERHGQGKELKAVTYHALRVIKDDANWLAEVIFDI